MAKRVSKAAVFLEQNNKKIVLFSERKLGTFLKQQKKRLRASPEEEVGLNVPFSRGGTR